MSHKINSILEKHVKKLELRLKKRESAKHEKLQEFEDARAVVTDGTYPK